MPPAMGSSFESFPRPQSKALAGPGGLLSGLKVGTESEDMFQSLGSRRHGKDTCVEAVFAENCVSGAEDIGQNLVLEYTLCQRKEGMLQEE